MQVAKDTMGWFWGHENSGHQNDTADAEYSEDGGACMPMNEPTRKNRSLDGVDGASHSAD